MPGPSAIFDNPSTAGKAITAIAGGATASDVAGMIGCSRFTVHKFKSREDIKIEIDAQAQALMAAVPTAVQIKTRTMEAGGKALNRELDDSAVDRESRGNDIKMIAQANSASDTVLQTAGILPSHTESRTLIAILSGASDQLDPLVSRMLGVGQEIDVTPIPECETEED